MNTQSFINDGQKFPLSTESLNFIQEQIKLVYGLTDLAGANVIIKDSTATKDGLVIFDGELLPLKGTHNAYISLVQSKETLSIGDFSENVRTLRVAVYGNRPDSSAIRNVPSSSFSGIKNILTLMDELKEAKKHHTPKGAIMMWSGTMENIPQGWALCDGQNGTPNLQGRFIVGATTGVVMFDSIGYNYPIGTTGGKNKVKLQPSESGLPAHSHGMANSGSHAHKFSYYSNGEGGSDTEHTCNWNVDGKANAHPVSGSGSGTKVDAVRISASYGSTWIGNDYIQMKNAGSHNHTINNNAATAASEAHENRPVYYALAYIMKVI